MKIRSLSLILYMLAGAAINTASADDPEASEPQVSLELLEFLGNFSTVDGIWIDPLEVTTMLEETPVSTEEQKEKSE